MSARSEEAIRAVGYTSAGNFRQLLEAAGLVRRWPIYCWWTMPDLIDPTKPPTSSNMMGTFTRVDGLDWSAMAPQWAYDLAHKLSRDKQLARALGFTKKRERVTEYGPLIEKKVGKHGRTWERQTVSKTWKTVDKDKILPMHLRVKILQVAAENEIARELIMDDPHAAGLIIMDRLKEAA